MMNHTARLLAALSHKNVDRPPVTGLMTSVTTELMDKTGACWPQAHFDAGLMVTLASAAYEHYGLESLKLPFDMAVEAQALGAAPDFGTRSSLPQIKKNPFDDPCEMKVDRRILDNGRVPLVLHAIGLAKRKYESVIPVVSSIVGPFTLSAMLFGFENVLVWMATEPETLESALSLTTEIGKMYADEQVNAGSDVIQIGEASCSGDLISGDSYGKFIAKYHKKLCASISIPTVVHICGNITSHLPYIKETGMSCISMDAKTDIPQAMRLFKGNTAIAGYVPTLEILRDGTPEQVYEYAVGCVKAGVDVLNAGCAWPPDLRGENIVAMIRAAGA